MDTRSNAKCNNFIPFKFNGFDCFAIMLLMFIGTFCRFWRIHQPRGYLYSEIDTLSAIHNYSSGNFFYECKPPLGRIFLYQLSKKISYDYSYNLSTKNGYTYPSVFYISLRTVSTMLSVLVTPLSYLILRLFNCNKFVSGVCGLFCFMEPSLISTGRMISDDGFVQFFGCLSMLCAAFSYHYSYHSNEQKAFIFCQGIFAGIAFSASYNCLIYVVFALLWSLLKFSSKKQMKINLLIILIVYYITVLAHILMTQKYDNNNILFEMLLKIKTDNNHLGIKHILLAFNYIIRQIFDFILKSINSLKIKKIIHKLFIIEKPTLLYVDSKQKAYCFVNKYVSIPSLIISYYTIYHGISMKIFDIKFIISSLFITSTILNAISYHQKGCIDSHISAFIGIISFGLNIEHLFDKYMLSSILTFWSIFSLFIFIKSSTIIFSYPSD